MGACAGVCAGVCTGVCACVRGCVHGRVRVCARVCARVRACVCVSVTCDSSLSGSLARNGVNDMHPKPITCGANISTLPMHGRQQHTAITWHTYRDRGVCIREYLLSYVRHS